MFHVVCASAASHLLTKTELLTMLEECRRNNSELGITGMLLYREGAFLQVLEGRPEAVMRVIDDIKGDPRHNLFRMILNGTSEERLFPEWSMGFQDLTDVSLAETAGYSDFLNTSFTGAEFSANPERCMKLLLSFKKHM